MAKLIGCYCFDWVMLYDKCDAVTPKIMLYYIRFHLKTPRDSLCWLNEVGGHDGEVLRISWQETKILSGT